ncbi:hypothetical protein [uncultured Tateyamaria sp.]|uniref:hypothetical protein n=1 Tax=uncultured Tateyamaria sp. TaxID=455651 RepID=UPI00262A49F8|nr:hypothetical protein [uncultured Tateyamaria sp.]
MRKLMLYYLGNRVRETKIPEGQFVVSELEPSDWVASPKAVEDASLVGTHDLFHSSQRIYRTTFDDALSRFELTERGLIALDAGINRGHFSSRGAAQEKLAQPLAQDTMMILLKESSFLSDEGLELAGHGRGFEEQCMSMNKNSLCNRICDDLGMTSASEVKRVATQLTRYLSAMEVFDLVEVTTVRANLCKIVVKENLDHVIRTSLNAVADLYDKQIGEDEVSDD